MLNQLTKYNNIKLTNKKKNNIKFTNKNEIILNKNKKEEY